MAQEYHIQNVRNRNKMDKFNNMTFDVKFAEDERTVYAAFKSTPEVGSTKYGDIVDGEYGARFKGAQKPEYEQSRPVSTPTKIAESFNVDRYGEPTGMPSHISGMDTPTQPNANKGDDRQAEIRYQVCFKAACDYVTKNRPDLGADEFAVEVADYAGELYKVNQLPKDQTSTAREVMGM